MEIHRLGVSLEELGIAVGTSHILGRTGADGTHKAWIIGPGESVVDFLNPDHMMPVVAEVVDVMDRLRSGVFYDIEQAGLAGRERAVVEALGIGDAPADASCAELVEVRVAPARLSEPVMSQPCMVR
ncbi:hypothetical protein APX01_19530 (plasmid) [Cereibacter sphaeroides]|nr:hypothetical protein APX01_19530 [Cereibacter sphaeroides]ANS36519.1 hypothetical protein A3858_19815 [Cereibacter sphaeroides]ATN65531.1 hypothetical protein A3857_19560 [Cereibacter sphaeroides]